VGDGSPGSGTRAPPPEPASRACRMIEDKGDPFPRWDMVGAGVVEQERGIDEEKGSWPARERRSRSSERGSGNRAARE
jgi:hypothetical protein